MFLWLTIGGLIGFFVGSKSAGTMNEMQVDAIYHEIPMMPAPWAYGPDGYGHNGY